MYTDIELEDLIYSILTGSAIADAVTGEIYKGEGERPQDSTKEDIVIMVLANQNAEIQTATIVVNIYVQDKPRDGEFKQDKPRLRELSSMAKAQMKKPVNRDGYRIVLDRQRVNPMPSTHEHVITTRLSFQYNNTD